MITLQRTRDMDVIREIARDSRIWDQMADDHSGSREEYEPPSDGAVYVAVMLNGRAEGFFALIPKTPTRIEVHTCLTPDLSPWQKMEAGAQLPRWVWANTSCIRIYTEIPTCNQAAYGFAKACGMTQSGVEPQCFLKGGVLHDVYVMGMNRPTIEQG